MTSRIALGCLIVSAVLGTFSYPRIFYGNGSTSAPFSLDGLFYAAQWGALVFALAALALSGSVWWNAGNARTTSTLLLPVCSAAMLVFLMIVGVPHNANQNEWRSGELGLAAFLRGMARNRKANAKPVQLAADSFKGEWRARDSTIYSFNANSITWRSPSASGEYSASACASPFELQYVQRDREVLLDLGLTWSKHAGALHDSTAADAHIPTAELTCGNSVRVLFVRASQTEVWRLTSTLDLETIKSDGFVLRLVNAGQ